MSFSRFDTFARSVVGPAAAGALVYLVQQPAITATNPPSPLATIYSDPLGANPIPGNVMTADGFGHASCYVASGTYTEVVVYGGQVVQVYPDQFINSSLVVQVNGFVVNGNPVAGPNFNSTTPAAPAGATAVQWQFDGLGNVSGYLFTSIYAPLASPAFTGNPTAPTPAVSDNSTALATTAFVQSLIGTPITSISSDDTLTVTQTGGAVELSLNLANENTWTAQQNFGTIAPANIIGSVTYTGNSTFGGLITGNLTGVALPVVPTNYSILSALSGTSNRIASMSFGGSGYFSAVSFGGTATAPTAVAAGTEIGGFNAFAYNGVGLNGPIGALRIYANQNQTAFAAGTHIDIATTPNGSLTQAEVIRFENDGGITVPSTVTGGDQGAGTINAKGLYVNGATVLTAGGPSGNINPATSNPAITGQSLGISTAVWQASYANFKQANAIVYADQFPGADAFAQINNAIAALPAAGGTVDARGFGAGNQAVSTQLIVGSSSKQVNLIVDANTNYIISTTGGVDAIELWTKSSIVALGATNANTATFSLGSAANVNSILATYPQTTETIVYLQGLTFEGNASATVADSILNLVNITDMSTFRNLVVYNFYGTGIHVQCKNSVAMGPMNFDNCSVNGSGNTGAQPFLIDSGTGTGLIAGVNLLGGSYTHPGPGGLPIIWIKAPASSSESFIAGVSFFGCQMESINSGDIGILIENTFGVLVDNCVFTSGVTPGTSCIKVVQDSGGVVINCKFNCISNYNGWTNTIQDTMNSVTVTDGYVTSYKIGTNSAAIERWTGAYGTYGTIMQLNKSSLILNVPISQYNGVATAGNGVPAEVNQIASTGLTANYNSGSAKTIFTPAAASQLRISYSQAITTAGSASSTFPSLTLGWTDVGGIARTKVLVATSATNTTAVESDGVVVITTNGSAVVTVTSASYAASSAASMHYALSVTTEVL